MGKLTDKVAKGVFWVLMEKFGIRNCGGLHNRVTARIWLMPFALGECERYAAEHGLEMSRGELAECCMIFGGTPYYWRCLQRGLSLAQNVDRACAVGSDDRRFVQVVTVNLRGRV